MTMIGATIYTYLSGNIRESNNKIRFFGTKFQNVPFFVVFGRFARDIGTTLFFITRQGSQKTPGRAHRKHRAALTENGGQRSQKLPGRA
jgi:hypothetical protein